MEEDQGSGQEDLRDDQQEVPGLVARAGQEVGCLGMGALQAVEALEDERQDRFRIRALAEPSFLLAVVAVEVLLLGRGRREGYLD